MAHIPALGPTGAFADELAEVIGQPALVQLCEALGGAKIYVPKIIGPAHPIGVAIGAKASAILADHYFGLSITLPKAHARRQRVIELAQSGTMTVAEAARACDYTERRVYQLLAALKVADPQLDLFA